MERGRRVGFTEAVLEDGASPRRFLRHGSNRVAAVVFGASQGPRPRGTQAEFRSGRLGGRRRIGTGQRSEAELNDLLGALTDLTLNTQAHIRSRPLLLRLVPARISYLDLRG